MKSSEGYIEFIGDAVWLELILFTTLLLDTNSILTHNYI